MFRTFLIAIGAFIICGLATYAAVFFGTLAVWQMLGVVDRDGGGVMGLGFVIAPVIALVAGGAGAIFAAIYVRRQGNREPDDGNEQLRDVARTALLAGVLAGGLAGHLLAKFAFWLAGPIRYDSMWKAMAHAWAPTIIMAAGAAAGGLLTKRLLRSQG